MIRRLLAPTIEVHAHCDLPCGVYDPAQARIEAESIKAIIGKVADNDDADGPEFAPAYLEVTLPGLGRMWGDLFGPVPLSGPHVRVTDLASHRGERP